ncbi:MAG: site-specific integrase [Thaumarchaeota archaeon]|nr:site-specific integrase [Nitrososphaerota archaeon]
MQQRSILIFEQSIKSPTTRLNYKSNLERFLKFAKIRDYDALLSMSEDDLQELVENYVIDLKGRVNPNSIPCMMSGVKHFFEMNRKRLYWKIIQKIYPEKIKRAGYNSWSTEQVRKMLEYNTSKRNKAIIHFMASTGTRVGVFDYDLSMKRLRDMEDGCKAVLIYAGEPDEYWTFLTPEAASALEEYFEKRRKDGEIFNPDTPILHMHIQDSVKEVYRLSVVQ